MTLAKGPGITLMLAVLGALLNFPLAVPSLGPAPAIAGIREVPDVKGEKISQAIKTLKSAGFGVKTHSKDTVHPGKHQRVYRQYPRAGSISTKKNAVVTLYYYDMRKQNLLNTTLPKASSPLPSPAPESASEKTAKSKPGPAAPPSPLQPKAANSQLIRVPLVLGMTPQAARSLLKNMKLTALPATPFPTEIRSLDGLVARQEPFSGTMVPADTEVKLTLYEYREKAAPSRIYQKHLPAPMRTKPSEQGDKEAPALPDLKFPGAPVKK